MVELKPVTQENFRACIKLNVAESQRNFVASNMYTIAEAYIDPKLTPFAITDDETVVGLVATEIVPENEDYDRYWITRFMVGESFQGKGYGRKGAQLAIEMLSKHEDCERVRLSVVSSNDDSIAFYQKIGFVLTDEYIGNERVMDYFLT